MYDIPPPLTERQSAALTAIRTHIKETGFPPTQKELAEYLGKSPATARQYLLVLQRKGYLKLWHSYSRGITVLERGATHS